MHGIKCFILQPLIPWKRKPSPHHLLYLEGNHVRLFNRFQVIIPLSLWIFNTTRGFSSTGVIRWMQTEHIFSVLYDDSTPSNCFRQLLASVITH